MIWIGDKDQPSFELEPNYPNLSLSFMGCHLKKGYFCVPHEISFLAWETSESGHEISKRVGSRVSILDFMWEKNYRSLHLLIWKSLDNPKKGAWINHLDFSMRASTLEKNDPIKTLSGRLTEIERSVRLLDIRKNLIPYLSVVIFIDPYKGNEFCTQLMRSNS